MLYNLCNSNSAIFTASTIQVVLVVVLVLLLMILVISYNVLIEVL